MAVKAGANLADANLAGAYLAGANLAGAQVMYFCFNKHTAYFNGSELLNIGCENKPLEWWKENYRKCGERNKYSEIEILAYGRFIDTCIEVFEANQKEKK